MKLAMAASSDSLTGWTIAEAIKRTSDADNLVDLANKNRSMATRQAISLRDQLLGGQLVATGCFEIHTASPVPIDPKVLLTLDWSGSPSSTLSGAAESELRVFNFRIFPVLRAPNAAGHLSGLSIVEV